MALFFHFSVIDSLVLSCSWWEFCKSIQLMLEFLKAPFLVLHFSFYTLMAFLMILSVTLRSVLMILHSALKVIMHLIFRTFRFCFLTWIWPKRHCEMGKEMGSWFQCWKKLNWFRLTGLIILVLLMWKWMDLFLKKIVF